MNPEPTAEDWIIMRLLRNVIKHNGPFGASSQAARNSTLFLIQKLGYKNVCEMRDQLEREEGKLRA